MSFSGRSFQPSLLFVSASMSVKLSLVTQGGLTRPAGIKGGVCDGAVDSHHCPHVNSPVCIRHTHCPRVQRGRQEPYLVRQTQWYASFVSVVKEIAYFLFVFSVCLLFFACNDVVACASPWMFIDMSAHARGTRSHLSASPPCFPTSQAKRVTKQNY